MWWTKMQLGNGNGWAATAQAEPQGEGQSETNAMGRAKCELKQQQDVERGSFKAGGGGRWAVEALIQTDTVWTTLTKPHINMEPTDSLQKMILSF